MKLRTLMVATAGTAVAAGALGPSAIAAETTSSTSASATTSVVATTTPKATATSTPATTTSAKDPVPTVTVTVKETVTPTPKATETDSSKVTATSTAPSSTAPKWLQPRENEQEILEAIATISIVVTTLAAGISSLIVFINSIPGGREALRKFFNQ